MRGAVKLSRPCVFACVVFGAFTSKLHCLADALGRPVAFLLTDGEAADCKAYDGLIGLPERTPDALLADQGYDADAIRAETKDT